MRYSFAKYSNEWTAFIHGWLGFTRGRPFFFFFFYEKKRVKKTNLRDNLFSSVSLPYPYRCHIRIVDSFLANRSIYFRQEIRDRGSKGISNKYRFPCKSVATKSKIYNHTTKTTPDASKRVYEREKRNNTMENTFSHFSENATRSIVAG